MNSRVSLDDILAGIRLLGNLPVFLRSPVNGEQAWELVQSRLRRREADFLTLMRRGVYGRRGSPYRRLLELAGCEYGDLEKLVLSEGVEGALKILCRDGVYLTVDEFKGRQPVVRGSSAMAMTTADLRNPGSSVHLLFYTSGGRGPATAVGIDLAHLRDEAPNLSLFFNARGGQGWTHAIWGIPGSSVVRVIFRLASCGAPLTKWFSQVDPDTPSLHPRYRWSTRLMRAGGVVAARPIPPPQHVSLEDPFPIVQWMSEVLTRGAIPHLWTYASSAVRVAEAALRARIDLPGAQFTLLGEPVTAARLDVIRRAGGAAASYYASMESGHIAYGCLTPELPDDLHVLSDLYSVIPAGPAGASAGFPPHALLVSTLRSTPPFILLNVSLGDQGTIVERQCGCPLEQVGWRTHLHTIRSHEKLTAGGMTFLDRDVVRILDEVLPAKFGGAPTHYQLVEEEAEDGRPCLRLQIHPSIGPVDPDAVAEAFLSALASGSGADHVMGLAWRDGGFLRVERRAPRSSSGKILHLLETRPLEG